ncbi:MAG: hypothetical protein AAF512_07700 [Pseudomonadota bacterium]
MRLSLGIVLGLLAGTQVFAATLIEGFNKVDSERPEKMLIEGKNAKMEMGMPNGQYILIKLNEGKVYMVNPPQKQIMDVLKGQDQMPKPPASNRTKPKYDIVKKGSGPEIAGYKTEHYQLMANDKLCSNEYLSTDAMKVKHVASFMEAMKKMNEMRQESYRNMPFAAQDPCDELQADAVDELAGKGFSMRSADAEGNVRREVSSIKTGIAVQPGTFDLPKGYQVTSPYEMLQKVMKGMSQNNAKPGLPNADPEAQQQLSQQLLQKLKEAQDANAGAPKPPMTPESGQQLRQQLLQKLQEAQEAQQGKTDQNQ